MARPPQYDPARLRTYLALTAAHPEEFQKWVEYGFEPPADSAFWCAVHQRPLTHQEANYAGGGPRCSWCRAHTL